MQVTVAEGKVSPEKNRTATRASATSLLSHFIGGSESHDGAWGEKSRVPDAKSHGAREDNVSASDLTESTFSGGRG